MSERQRGANAGERRAGDDVAGGVMLMVAVTLVVSVVLVVGAMSFLPETDDPATRPDADFSIERDDGDIVVEPRYMTEGTPFTLLINGRESTSGRAATPSASGGSVV